MKILLIILFLLFSATAWGDSNVITSWQPNSKSDLKEYRLYQSDVSGAQNPKLDTPVAIIPAGTEMVEIVAEDGIWFWILTAVDEYGNQSLRSSEATADLDSIAPEAPYLNTVITITVMD